jgi:hypothetical protein
VTCARFVKVRSSAGDRRRSDAKAHIGKKRLGSLGRARRSKAKESNMRVGILGSGLMGGKLEAREKGGLYKCMRVE